MVGRADGDGMRITDYNAAEGDALVLDGREFDAANLRLLGGRLSTLDGAPGVYASLSLVEVNGSGAVARTLFSFDNAADIDQLILRLPIPDGNGPLLVLDLV